MMGAGEELFIYYGGLYQYRSYPVSFHARMQRVMPLPDGGWQVRSDDHPT